MTTSLLDNIVWNTLTGPHAPFAAGLGGARRYAVGFSPILGFEHPAQPRDHTRMGFRDHRETVARVVSRL